jgi:pimeloyl-ACP methyl ester carboxylesterase
MQARDLSVDVDLWDDEDVAVFGRLFEPDEPDGALPLLFCLPGGTYGHRYWDLEVPGGGYSFAAEMCTRGYSVVAIDNLGTGASSRPEHRAGLAELAAAADAVVELVRRELSPRAVVGVGHSMGGYTLVTQQASARSCDAIAVLGSVIGPSTIVPIPDEVVESARGGPDARTALADAAEPFIPGDFVPTARVGGGMEVFHLDDVPQHVLDADVAQTATNLSSRAAAEASVPWFTSDAAATIDVPVFLAFGQVDVSPSPYEEPGCFTASRDVTLFVLAQSAHCHNMATTRLLLWDRLDRWVRSLRV